MSTHVCKVHGIVCFGDHFDTQRSHDTFNFRHFCLKLVSIMVTAIVVTFILLLYAFPVKSIHFNLNCFYTIFLPVNTNTNIMSALSYIHISPSERLGQNNKNLYAAEEQMWTGYTANVWKMKDSWWTWKYNGKSTQVHKLEWCTDPSSLFLQGSLLYTKGSWSNKYLNEASTLQNQIIDINKTATWKTKVA